MSKEPEPEELQVILADEVQAKIDADPGMRAAIRDFIASMHQARAGVLSGQYKMMDDAMQAITGSRPQKIDPETGEVIEGASMHEDMNLGVLMVVENTGREGDDDDN